MPPYQNSDTIFYNLSQHAFHRDLEIETNVGEIEQRECVKIFFRISNPEVLGSAYPVQSSIVLRMMNQEPRILPTCQSTAKNRRTNYALMKAVSDESGGVEFLPRCTC